MMRNRKTPIALMVGTAMIVGAMAIWTTGAGAHGNVPRCKDAAGTMCGPKTTTSVKPSTSQPSTSVPPSTDPSTSVPPTTKPTTTEPPTTEPPTTDPSTTLPSTTLPPTTDPPTTQPPSTEPATTAPPTSEARNPAVLPQRIDRATATTPQALPRTGTGTAVLLFAAGALVVLGALFMEMGGASRRKDEQ